MYGQEGGLCRLIDAGDGRRGHGAEWVLFSASSLWLAIQLFGGDETRGAVSVVWRMQQDLGRARC